MHIVHAASTVSTEEGTQQDGSLLPASGTLTVCSSLNVIGPNKLIGIDTLRRAFLGVDNTLLREVCPMGVDLEVSYVPKPWSVPQSTVC